MNEYREFQKSLRIKKEQLESSLKEELKQLEQKHRQELQDLKTLHQRKRTQLTQELTLEREQRALDRLNKSMVSVRGKEKLDETKSTKKRKRTNNKQEQVTSDVELTVNEIVEEIIQNDDEKENKKQKKSPNTTVDQDYDKDAVVDVVDENDVCEESVVKISSSSQQLHSTQQSIPPCAQIERTLSKRRSSASIQNENENEKVAECERHE